jgi:hypothetical protein
MFNELISFRKFAMKKKLVPSQEKPNARLFHTGLSDDL